MNVSVEISMYPLADEFIPAIQGFIDDLNAHNGIKVITNTMSTQVFGDYAEVMRIVSLCMQKAHETTPKAPFVMKVLNGDLSPQVD
ncbi:YkoF family thiamine/hydroxymethylpyrimidine-binding protein [Marinicella rhabdoformis]|uniref:YkoF family thiamine/hydroxymethylpyrimidine-binding protein n=1 Tax=Marinicella rhabdoformis TaxID=2580566 RepID=UPI0012AED828|nr:YkoF family thiamine/hydroxymethylpyrimidine-binding protein [Marinicella rhabdoformis]